MRNCLALLSVALTSLSGTAAYADAPTPASAPSSEKLVYEVQLVQGKVKVAPTGTDVLSETGWTRVKAGDILVAGQELDVPMRSKIKFVARPANPPTVIMIESMTHFNISALEVRDGAAYSRIELAHGAIRAGVAEGSNRSDMQIATPAATLSKKGTDIFRMEYIN